jgi:hypothetical protein
MRFIRCLQRYDEISKLPSVLREDFLMSSERKIKGVKIGGLAKM